MWWRIGQNTEMWSKSNKTKITRTLPIAEWREEIRWGIWILFLISDFIYKLKLEPNIFFFSLVVVVWVFRWNILLVPLHSCQIFRKKRKFSLFIFNQHFHADFPTCWKLIKFKVEMWVTPHESLCLAKSLIRLTTINHLFNYNLVNLILVRPSHKRFSFSLIWIFIVCRKVANSRCRFSTRKPMDHVRIMFPIQWIFEIYLM